MIKKQGTILIVDDNRNILTTVRMLLEPIFDGIITIANPNSIPAKLREEHPDVVLLDMNFSSGINSGNEGLYWLREIKSLSPKTEVVLFTAYADIQLAVTGIKEGAADFIVKPFENEKMIRTLVEARDKNRAVDNVINRKGGKPGGKDAQSAMYWGDSEVMNNLRSIVEKVAATDANILITGENGTGKEVLANEIHRLSTRCRKKMLPVDMGAITETLFESELFGHVKGAFTDAKIQKKGVFERASGGTLFLDEIGELSLAAQVRLLRVLQQKIVTRIGGMHSIPVDFRLVAATHRDLKQMAEEGRFRNDLLYRLNLFPLRIPPLRERQEDLFPLTDFFLNRLRSKYGISQPLSLSQKSVEQMQKYKWPGNVRELENTLERSVLTSSDYQNIQIVFEGETGWSGPVVQAASPEQIKLESFEMMQKHYFEAVLKATKGKISGADGAAALTDMHPNTLRSKLEKLGVTFKAVKPEL